MSSTNNHINETDSYFKRFAIQHKDYLIFDELSEKTIAIIESEIQTNFTSNWRNLIVLMQIIERVYKLKSIITEENYFRFEFRDDENIQDKGATKIDALYSCCYQTLRKYWKEDVTVINLEVDSHDVDEFDKTKEEYNEEGFKEYSTKEFLKSITDSQLVSMYKVTKYDNPSKVKLISWLKQELDKRKLVLNF